MYIPLIKTMNEARARYEAELFSISRKDLERILELTFISGQNSKAKIREIVQTIIENNNK